jgi:hypothetical protein
MSHFKALCICVHVTLRQVCDYIHFVQYALRLVRGILFYRCPIVSAQGLYELVKYVTSAACSANIACFYMAHLIVNGSASIFLHFQ